MNIAQLASIQSKLHEDLNRQSESDTVLNCNPVQSEIHIKGFP